MENKLRAALSFISYLLVLLNMASCPHVRHPTVVPQKAGSAQPGRPSRRERSLFPASTSGEQHHNPIGFWHSAATCPWCCILVYQVLRASLLPGVWTCLQLRNLLGGKGKISHIPELTVFSSCSLPWGSLSLAENNSPDHQNLFLRFKII